MHLELKTNIFQSTVNICMNSLFCCLLLVHMNLMIRTANFVTMSI